MTQRSFLFRIRAVHKFKNKKTYTQFLFVQAQNKQEAIDWAYGKIKSIPTNATEVKLFTKRRAI